MRSRIRIIALAIGSGTLLAHVAGATETPTGGYLRARSDSVAADASRQWQIDFTIGNAGDYGLLLDSLMLVSTPLAGPNAGRSTRQLLQFGLTEIPVSAHQEQWFQTRLPAARVPTHLTFELATHSHGEVQPLIRASVVGGAYDPAAFFPPIRVRVAGRAVEMTRIERPMDAAAPGLLLLPDDGADVVPWIDEGIVLAAQGYTVVLAAPPGMGGSEGPADLAGPASLAAAEAALDTLVHSAGVAPGQLAVWGTGTGGTLALLLADRRAEINAVIAQGASVDPWATYRALPLTARAGFVRATGRDSAAWRARSPRSHCSRIKAAVLLQHGERDPVAPSGAVRELAAVLAAQGVVVESSIEPGAPHELPVLKARRAGIKFLKTHLATSR